MSAFHPRIISSERKVSAQTSHVCHGLPNELGEGQRLGLGANRFSCWGGDRHRECHCSRDKPKGRQTHAEVRTPATAHRAELCTNGFLRGYQQTPLSEWSLDGSPRLLFSGS